MALIEMTISRISSKGVRNVGHNFLADSAKRRHPGNETPWKVGSAWYARKFTGQSENDELEEEGSLRSVSFSLF